MVNRNTSVMSKSFQVSWRIFRVRCREQFRRKNHKTKNHCRWRNAIVGALRRTSRKRVQIQQDANAMPWATDQEQGQPISWNGGKGCTIHIEGIRHLKNNILTSIIRCMAAGYLGGSLKCWRYINKIIYIYAYIDTYVQYIFNTCIQYIYIYHMYTI